MFPVDDYTPHGYLANRTLARSWREAEGGVLRSTDERPGFAWWYPCHQRGAASCSLEFALEVDGRRYETRAEWAEFGLHAAFHGARLFTFGGATRDLAVLASFFLVHDDTLGCALQLLNRTAQPLRVTLSVAARGHAASGPAAVTACDGSISLAMPDAAPRHAVSVDAADARPTLHVPGAAEYRMHARLLPDDPRRFFAALGRGLAAATTAAGALTDAGRALIAAGAADDAFWEAAPRLAGDWPDSWRRGWVYDLETARLCLAPPMGRYRDVWPVWSANWPRSVLAEGALDMLRLALAAPDLARRAVLSLFRDAPAANLPCVFGDGTPNMVAEDGAACGTSPAWCLPFQSLHLMERLAPDHAWQAALYPYLARYLDFWLTRRADRQGWLSYHCSWESGEDESERVDPRGRGDRVTRGLTRPVELQAAMAHGAALLGRWAASLGRRDDARHWRRVAAGYRRRTRALWDAAEGRFHDQDAGGAWLPSCGERPYWGIDPCRDSVLALLPALGGVATAAQRRVLAEREVGRFLRSPWLEWPSWSWTLAEAAHALGRRDLAGTLSASILGRVYPENDRRITAPDGGPLPGVAREWWPLDLARWQGAGEAYGWGGTTALLLLRHVFGFLPDTGPGDARRFTLAPALPPDLLTPGRTYRLENLSYRNCRLDIGYTVRHDGRLDAEVQDRESRRAWRVVESNLGRSRVELD